MWGNRKEQRGECRGSSYFYVIKNNDLDGGGVGPQCVETRKRKRLKGTRRHGAFVGGGGRTGDTEKRAQKRRMSCAVATK